jgi:type IV pilus assembly protein PilA
MNKKRSIAKYAVIGIFIAMEIVLLSEMYPPAADLNGQLSKIICLMTDLLEELPSFLILAGLTFAIPYFLVTGIWSLFITVMKKEDSDDKIGPVFRLIITVMLLMAWVVVVPNIFRYPARSKQTEAKYNLGSIYSAYQAYHNDYNTYPSSPFFLVGNASYDCFQIAGWEPKDQIRNNYNCMNTEVFSPATNDSPCPPGIYTTANKDSFTVAACGNVDNDTTIDVWTINDQKKLKNVVDDVKE